jgi:hypothetical protein
MQEEIWKDIPGYEGFYQVSNLGNVKGLPRELFKKGKYPYICREKVLKQGKTKTYNIIVLTKNKNRKTIYVHQLVAMTFFNHKRCGHKIVVDHINNDKLDNRVENLQIITQRENTTKDRKGTSKHPGVNWCKHSKKWKSQIVINGKQINLGYYDCELKASLVYQNKLKELNNK